MLMKKNILFILILIFSILFCASAQNYSVAANNNKKLKTRIKKTYKPAITYKEITIAKGNFIRALVRNTVSTKTNKVDDVVYLMIEDDFYVGDYKCIPKNSLLVGKIKDIVQESAGLNAVLKVNFYKLIFPDNTVNDIEAHIWSKSGDYLGGELTDYAGVRKVPNISTKVGPIMQLMPAGTRKVGNPVILNPGDEKVIVLDADLILKIKE